MPMILHSINRPIPPHSIHTDPSCIRQYLFAGVVAHSHCSRTPGPFCLASEKYIPKSAPLLQPIKTRYEDTGSILHVHHPTFNQCAHPNTHRTHDFMRKPLADGDLCSPASSHIHIAHKRWVPFAPLSRSTWLRQETILRGQSTPVETILGQQPTCTYSYLQSILTPPPTLHRWLVPCVYLLRTRISVRQRPRSFTSLTNVGSLLPRFRKAHANTNKPSPPC